MAQELTHRASTELALDAPATGLRRWISLTANSALVAGDEFDPVWAKRKLLELREDIPTLLRAMNDAVVPTSPDWLADRLKIHWKSSTPTNAMEAKSWLHETGRLLMHIPQDILAHAIDEAIRTAGNSFTRTAADIIGIAEPILRERRKVQARLDTIVNGPKERKKYPWEQEEEFNSEDRCKPEEAAEIMKEFGLDEPIQRSGEAGRDYSNLRQPTRHELEEMAREYAEKYPPKPEQQASESEAA